MCLTRMLWVACSDAAIGSVVTLVTSDEYILDFNLASKAA